MPIRRQTKGWVTRAGQRLRICDMEDGHLYNCIQLLRRRKVEILERAYASLQFITGELALDDMETGIEALECSDIEQFEYGEALLLDAERRGLEGI